MWAFKAPQEAVLIRRKEGRKRERKVDRKGERKGDRKGERKEGRKTIACGHNTTLTLNFVVCICGKYYDI